MKVNFVDLIEEWAKRLRSFSGSDTMNVIDEMETIVLYMTPVKKKFSFGEDTTFDEDSEKFSFGGDTGTDADSNVTVITDPDEYEEFLATHINEVEGLFRDKYFRNGGWNGFMDALNEVEKRNNIVLESDSWEDGLFEEIINRNR
jgi:hypothetical protein